MAYTRINPFTEQVVKTYDEHTDAELEDARAGRHHLPRRLALAAIRPAGAGFEAP
jgi:hypothetical protein